MTGKDLIRRETKPPTQTKLLLIIHEPFNYVLTNERWLVKYYPQNMRLQIIYIYIYIHIYSFRKKQNRSH